MSVILKIECHGHIVLESSFDEVSAATPAATPGPGVFENTGRHDGAEMATLRGTGDYKRLAASLQACKVEAERALTETMEANNTEAGSHGRAKTEKQKRSTGNDACEPPTAKRAN
mmetsp:Transcript_16915/g.33525  ORF Transcript_16915/g.33525 Transcript_16915/m.33525 type:complete len:115 (-) Transcript_16915:166-510(-)